MYSPQLRLVPQSGELVVGILRYFGSAGVVGQFQGLRQLRVFRIVHGDCFKRVEVQNGNQNVEDELAIVL